MIRLDQTKSQEITITGNGVITARLVQWCLRFIVQSDKTLKYVYYGKHVSDVPTPLTLAENLD